MSPRTLKLDGPVLDYLNSKGSREVEAQRALREESDRHLHGNMRSSAEQIALLGFLIETIDARSVLEVGCFTGYGTLGMALAVPPDGKIVSLDVNEDWAAIGRRYWEEAGVAERIEFRAGLALESMDRLLDEGRLFDLVYVDADKKSYPAYYARALKLVRQGGIVALDNMLRNGGVADPDDTTRQTAAIRELTASIREDPAVAMCLTPVGDGLMLVRKRIPSSA
ncbi:O-methyltransferase [Arboricoccus pini]|uniref:O-methyltransferase n=1 Tax=Arboricoccus pini TaxID=1963835 RepID=UPI0013FE2BF9|nr:class I SAM-dependent methyltransferase [Arboricoccus pini]